MSQLRTKYFENLIEILDGGDGEQEDGETKLTEYLNSFKNDNDEYSKKLSILESLEWLNVAKKTLSYETDLKGRLVLLDFWTYCCINCIHVMPLLKKLEDKFENLLVIGVHSAKFPNEKSKKNIEHAVQRHLIKHPVVCDNDLELWASLEINCWPTFMLLNPHGQIIAEFQGELQANLIEKFIEFCFRYYRNDLVASQFEALNVDTSSSDASVNTSQAELCFPSKLCVDAPKCSVLFISDTGNNRLLVVDCISGKLHYVIGTSGLSGYQDGGYENVRFRWPQGVVFDSDEQCLYVADTGNDLIRTVDLQKRVVNTLAGKYDGIKNIGDYDYTGGGAALEQSISSPWDLCLYRRGADKFLLIACAGTHQIWLYTFKKSTSAGPLQWWRNVSVTPETLVCVAGNGKERNRNNSYPLQASFAQPSGLSIDAASENLYIADAESSTIRVMSLKDGALKNIVGGDASQPDNLFAYGDFDGTGTQVRLQHPMDVKCYGDNELLVADAYNNKLKLVNIKSKSCKTLIEKDLLEPNGMCVVNGTLTFIADTNNHSIKTLVNTRISNFPLDFSSVYSGVSVTDNKTPLVAIDLDRIFIKLKEDIHLNQAAMNSWSLEVTMNDNQITKLNGKIVSSEGSGEQHELTSIDLDNVIKVNLKINLFYCIDDASAKEQVCKMLKFKQDFTKEQLLQIRENKRVLIEINNF